MELNGSVMFCIYIYIVSTCDSAYCYVLLCPTFNRLIHRSIIFSFFQEYLERGRVADRHRLGRLFAAWHLAALASSSSSKAVARGVRRRRDTETLASDFRAWASLSRARRWHRRHHLRQGLETLASFAAAGVGVVGGLGMVGRAPGARSGAAPRFVGSAELSLPPPSVVDDWPAARGQKRRQQFRGGDGEHGEKRVPRGRPSAPAGPTGRTAVATAVRVYEAEAVAIAHCRRAALSRGVRALLLLRRRRRPRWRAGSAAELRGRGQLFCCVHGDARKEGLVVSARAVRAALWAWYEAASASRRARDGVEVTKRRRLVGAVRDWRRFALAAARQRRADRMGLLKRSFVALRQVYMGLLFIGLVVLETRRWYISRFASVQASALSVASTSCDLILFFFETPITHTFTHTQTDRHFE